ncbi:hypothetical protein L5515_005492 [Caenorhabditis briggsae]|uniref:F-box domain-containing protein n=1 Tax=Caenorhabditis briggsae TaxID=6238 RepID=A0AAE9JF11_CAEBR|nr:hypothetical protein L5515_005492 [Caenorhabditis briggsae]
MEFFKKIIFKCQKAEEPQEIVFKPFRLLDLPDVVLIQVLQGMSPIQIIELTFCSKRTRLIIQSYVKSIMKHYELTAKFGGPTNRVRFSSSKNPEIYHKLIMEDSLFGRELNMTRRFIANRSVKAVYRETYPGSLITYWMDPIIGAQKFTEYVCATFRCNVTVELGLRVSGPQMRSTGQNYCI